MESHGLCAENPLLGVEHSQNDLHTDPGGEDEVTLGAFSYFVDADEDDDEHELLGLGSFQYIGGIRGGHNVTNADSDDELHFDFDEKTHD
ncbi:hypothetical protein ACHAQH_004154 [Verticillium albo-atrum]